jgi:Domain of unknown function (DUF4386)
MNVVFHQTSRLAEPTDPAGALRAGAISPSALARIAGVFYLIVAVTATFSEIVRSRLVASSDAAATAENLRSSSTMWRVSFAADLVQSVSFLTTAMVLYVLLKHVNQLVAAAMVVCVSISVAIQSLNLLNGYTALMIATDDKYSRAFGEPGSDALTLLFTNMREKGGFIIAQLFFGMWLLPLGYLVISSGYFPKLLGGVLIAGFLTYEIELFVLALAPHIGDNIGPFASAIEAITELFFLVWLIAKGVKTPIASGRPVGRVK